MTLLIYTDLDGTLLDAKTYSFAAAQGALRLLAEKNIPLIVCSSKTRAEILRCREALGNAHPFISENGGGIFVPEGYFPFDIPGAKRGGGCDAVTLGTPYPELRRALVALRSEGFDVTGFGDMDAEEVARLSGITREEAALAKQREFDEPFIFKGGGEDLKRLEARVAAMGLRLTKGRFMHLLGGNDKGRAMRIVRGFYGKAEKDVVTAAVGDAMNDLPMLMEADHPFLVARPDGSHEPGVSGGRIARTRGAGPAGWAEAVTGLLRKLGLA